MVLTTTLSTYDGWWIKTNYLWEAGFVWSAGWLLSHFPPPWRMSAASFCLLKDMSATGKMV